MVKTFFMLSLWALVSIQITTAQNLEQEAKTKINQLNELISTAGQRNIDTYKEQMTIRTAEIFLEFANWDENHLTENTTWFGKVPKYRDSANQMAMMLPDFERQEILIMLDEANAYLQALIDKEVFREPIPRIDWFKVTHEEDQLIYKDKPAFLAHYTWQPKVPKTTQYHGSPDGFFISPLHILDESGTINTSIINDLNTKPSGRVGFIFINNKSVPEWAKTKYGADFAMRGNTFTGYDIDHPGAREMMSHLLDGTIPKMAGKKYSELGYMLCNEPHFFTKAGAWATGPVSEYTIEKFKTWLAEKHATVGELNALWGSTFASFDEISIAIPISGSLQGSPMWYDWARFNMVRVTAYYKFMKAQVLKSDANANVHLKIMPRMWSDNWRDHGIDFEALTELSGIIGNDAGSHNNHMWGPTEWWEADYAFDWREMTMSYDFLKSVSPDKMVYNTESHYLSKNKSRDLYQDPPYVRATFWMAHTQGLNANQIWYWARRDGGEPRDNAGVGYAGSNNHQPRVVNEVASVMMDLNSFSEEITAMQRQDKPLRVFYSKTSAINKDDHMDDVFEAYKALFFEGTPLGFATENIINQQNHDDWEAIVVHKTEFITESELAALQNYLDNGGTVIIDGVSLTKNEYGLPMAELKSGGGSLIQVNSLAEMKEEAMKIVATRGHLPEVSLTETNAKNINGCTWKCIENDAGNYVLSIINLANVESTVALQLKDASLTTYCKDLLKGIYISPTKILQPNEVLFVEISDSLIVAPEPTGLIYPNPTQGSFEINFEVEQVDIELRIIDMRGRVVVKESYANTSQISKDISAHPAGRYLISLKSGNDEVQSYMLVKQ